MIHSSVALPLKEADLIPEDLAYDPQTRRWTIAGLIPGVAASITGARLLSSLLLQVQPGDPGVIAEASLLLSAVAALATLGPARRAARLDPMIPCGKNEREIALSKRWWPSGFRLAVLALELESKGG